MIDIVLKRSIILLVGLTAVHLFALMCVLFLLSGVVLKIVLSLMIIVSSFYYLIKYGSYKYSAGVRRLKLVGDGEWILINNFGINIEALLSGCYIGRFLMVLNFKVNGRLLKLSIPVFVDAIDAQTMRRLRCYLRML